MADDTWSGSALAGRFADDAYATVKGRVRTEVMHRQLLEHLPPPPAPVDAGFGATRTLATQLFTVYLLPFELTSVLLLVAIVGAIAIAQKRG